MEKANLKYNPEEYPPHQAVPQEIPKATIWPITLACGVIFFFWGFITSFFITAIGFILMLIAVAGWIGDLRP
jgi:hypothetical protein